jgi:hypothetical protein
MAVLVLLNPQILINSVDLTNRITEVKLAEKVTPVDSTAFGVTAKQYLAGLGDNNFSITVQQDYAGSETEQTIYPLIGTLVPVTVKPVNTTTSTTNPLYSFVVLVNEWVPVGGKPGDLVTTSATWPISGLVTKATS